MWKWCQCTRIYSTWKRNLKATKCLLLNLLNQWKWSKNIMFFNHYCQNFNFSFLFQRSSFTFSIPARHFHHKFTLNVIYLKSLLSSFLNYILLLILLCLHMEPVYPYRNRDSNLKIRSGISLSASIQSTSKSF